MPLDPLIHQSTRLQIMGILYRNREVAFTELRDHLDLTPGNLQSHAKRLIEAGLLEERRALVGINFELRYRITAMGRARYEVYKQDLLALFSP